MIEGGFDSSIGKFELTRHGASAIYRGGPSSESLPSRLRHFVRVDVKRDSGMYWVFSGGHWH
jgi:hypothetical protein